MDQRTKREFWIDYNSILATECKGKDERVLQVARGRLQVAFCPWAPFPLTTFAKEGESLNGAQEIPPP
jgi:hypothetical protein